jgi:alpha-1,2-mannosyltransferase
MTAPRTPPPLAGTPPQRRRGLAVAMSLALGAIGVLLVLTSRSARSGGLAGDFPVFYYAGLRLPAGENIYETIPQSGEYIYPPLMAALFAPLSRLGQAASAWTWASISVAALLAVLLVTARDTARRFRVDGGLRATLAIALLALLLSYDKTRAVISGGQSDIIMVLGVCLGMAFHDRRPALAGAALAFAANIKYTPLLFLAYLLLRGRWRAAAWTVVFFVAFALAPALVCGWSRNLELWRIALRGVLRLFGGSGDAGLAGSIQDATHPLSVSITSALARAMPGALAGQAGLAAGALIGLLVLGLSWLMFARRGIPLLPQNAGVPAPSTLAAVEWSGFVIAILALSPQTQGRHFVQLLAPNLVAAALLLRPPPGVPRTWLVLGLIAIEAGMMLPPGGRLFRNEVMWWQSVGGMAWCLLPYWFALLWTGLDAVRSFERTPAPLTPARTVSPTAGS